MSQGFYELALMLHGTLTTVWKPWHQAKKCRSFSFKKHKFSDTSEYFLYVQSYYLVYSITKPYGWFSVFDIYL